MDGMTEERPRLGIPRLIGDSVRLFFANAAFIYPIALAPTLAIAVVQFVLAPSTMGGDLTMIGAEEWLVMFALALAGFLVGGMVSLAAIDLRLGKRHSVGEYLGQAMRHAAPLIVLGVLFTLAVALGAVFLILPGLYLAARYLVYVPAVVFENAGWSGLGRAKALTEGYRWPLVGGFVLFMLVGAVLTIPVFIVAAVFGMSLIVEILAGVVAQAALACLAAIFTALVYLRLREIKDGESAADIAATID